MREDLLPAVAFAILGLIVGLAVAALAGGMSGAGHGWTSASISVFSIVAAPLTGIAWGFRRHHWSLWLSLLLVITAIVLDALLLLMTKYEGIHYFNRVLTAMTDGVMLWALLFATWQLWAITAAVSTMRTVKRTDGKQAASNSHAERPNIRIR
jgi:hypothetical protein